LPLTNSSEQFEPFILTSSLQNRLCKNYKTVII